MNLLGTVEVIAERGADRQEEGSSRKGNKMGGSKKICAKCGSNSISYIQHIPGNWSEGPDGFPCQLLTPEYECPCCRNIGDWYDPSKFIYRWEYSVNRT